MRSRRPTLALLSMLLCATLGFAIVATTINDFFLPGSQPGQSGQLETPDKCDNCHGGYNVQSPPVAYSYADGQYWDDTDYALPSGATYAEVRLYYQTTSRDYIEFLRDENRTNDWGTRIYQAWLAAGKSAPELMAMTAWGTPPLDTTPPTAPINLSASAASKSQINLSWNGSSDNLGVAGYYVYRDGNRVAGSTTTSYSDKGLKATTTYCYTVTAYDAAGNESTASNQACATTPRR